MSTNWPSMMMGTPGWLSAMSERTSSPLTQNGPISPSGERMQTGLLGNRFVSGVLGVTCKGEWCEVFTTRSVSRACRRDRLR